MVRRLLLPLVALLLGCELGTGPDDVRYVNRRPMYPVPPAFAELYRLTEECRGRAGNYELVGWFVADDIIRYGRSFPAAFDFPNRITIRSDVIHFDRLVRHESDHHIMKTGDALHLPDGTTACDGAIH